jgi:hypothetical protein
MDIHHHNDISIEHVDNFVHNEQVYLFLEEILYLMNAAVAEFLPSRIQNFVNLRIFSLISC